MTHYDKIYGKSMDLLFKKYFMLDQSKFQRGVKNKSE